MSNDWNNTPWKNEALAAAREIEFPPVRHALSDGAITRPEYELLAKLVSDCVSAKHYTLNVRMSFGLFTFEVIGEGANATFESCLDTGMGRAMAIYNDWYRDPLQQGAIVQARCLQAQGLLPKSGSPDLHDMDDVIRKVLTHGDETARRKVERCDNDPLGRSVGPSRTTG